MGGTIAGGELLKDRYRLERTLGRGGMAVVWLGHDEVLDRPVAVKVLADTISSDPGFLARFRREARTAAGLSHPNLADVYDFSEEGERPYLVMQFIPGEDLATRLARGERFDCERLAGELLDALRHIHEVGILHRDVKPGNVIVEPDGTAKLIDFGIALPRDATALTRTGLVLGSERYMAPEVMEGRPATERSDLYSCGALLRACQAQRAPALGRLVAAMTEADPRQRPLSAAQALEQLELLAEPVDPVEQPTAAFEPPFGDAGEPTGATRQLPRRGGDDRRKALGAGLAALAALAALVAVGALALGGGGDSGGEEPPRARASADRGEQARAPVSSAQQSAAPEPAVPSPRTTPDPVRGAALNEEGFALIEAGEPQAAVPLLEEAVAAFPEGTGDLNYAYALYNLGNALRLSGRPAEAIPILERRLEIPDQEAAVRAELEAARAEAGG